MEALKHAAESIAATNQIGRVSAASAWVEAAVSTGRARDAAAALRHQAAVLAEEPLTRVDGRMALLAAAQTAAAEAGYWTLRSRRRAPDTAVCVLEHSRAILLSSMVSGTDTGRLNELVRLGERGRQAVHDLLAAQRNVAEQVRLHLTRTGTGNHGAGESTAAHEFPQLLRARGGLWRAEQSAVRLLRTDPDNHSSTLGTIRDAASHGAMVYLASAAHTGYAVVVPVSGRTRTVLLPDLQAERMTQTPDTGEPNSNAESELHELRQALQPLVEEFRRGPLAAGLAACPLLTLVAVGTLSFLPLHAALLLELPALQGVRYAPNARLLRHAASRRPGDLAVLPMSFALVRTAPGFPDLVRGRTLAATYGAGPSPDDESASGDQLAATLHQSGIVHLHCHGRADCLDALDSALFGRDRAVSVREVLAHGGVRARLVVLMACEGHTVDRRLPDEVLGLPGTLVQSGAAAVVAAQWRVREQAAALVLRMFYDNIRAGHCGPTALAGAQRSLRNATARELNTRYGNAYYRCAPAIGGPPDQKPFASPEHWAAFAYTGL
ncbi:CHAT domain-containing protein [Streptomyces sp. NBC_01551]|uniref:CHAT domain-containing protein n=1 Tax=Streptomyces sp. NBC_01551 TaxID=2975876 RepID=UPI002257595E|nr:CHAT domain-containing protein [Streptomyces sp. NBC_01551]MCX4529924.1 CHAT domain-containing protein [Streptomyces sp. NBC_01551]